MTEPLKTEVAILNAALELSLPERVAYLDSACAADGALRQQVELLLRAHERAADFLESPPSGVDFKRTAPLPDLPTEKAGDRIGRYKLLQQIGEGGCGVVYMAEQEEPVRRRVALKIIKLGMDTKQVVARFEAERQALAMMDHPNIAKVLDAGATDTGRPYFVMELVRGIKITDFCDENKVSTQERLQFFIQVCQAIQHAHQKGIIHRDIKPSNILVTVNDGVPVPKVIDFGIAKATQGRLTDKTLFTAFEQFIGTPTYMSPEQAVMTSLDIDTRTDIYSLGVLLYELLTGKTPFDAEKLLASGLDELRRTIREVEPVKPSTRLGTMLEGELTTTALHRHTDAPKLMHLLRGDLDWIVMKCLEKDRARRYETANGLARDVERYLANEPVSARPPTIFYRLQKGVRRNKTAFAAAAGIAGVLLLGMGVSTSEAIRAARAEREQARLRRVAETNAKKSEHVARFLKNMLQGVGPSVSLGRDTTMLREIVDKTAERIGTELKDEPEVEIELRLVLGRLYGDLRLYRQEEPIARETLRLAREQFGEENVFAADASDQLGRALNALGQTEEAEALIRRAVAMQRKLRGEDSLEEASALAALADILRQTAGANRAEFTNVLSEAETAVRTALAIREKRMGHDSSAVVASLQGLNVVLENEGKLVEAEAAIREAIGILEKIDPEGHTLFCYAYERLARTLLAIGSSDRLQEAETSCRKGLEMDEGIVGKGKPSQAFLHLTFGEVLEAESKSDEAEAHYRQAAEIGKTSHGPEFRLALPWALRDLADLLRKRGQLADARRAADEAVAVCQQPDSRMMPGQLQASLRTLRDVLTDLGDTNALQRLELIPQTDLKLK